MIKFKMNNFELSYAPKKQKHKTQRHHGNTI
jgi:hypothetical protein